MRCIGSEGLDLSQLTSSPSPLQHSFDDVTMASVTTDVTSHPASAKAFSGSKSSVSSSDSSSSSSSSLASPQLSPNLGRSDIGLTPGESPVPRDLSTMSFRSILSAHPQQFTSMSSPELSTLTKDSQRSLADAGGDSPAGSSESSSTSTAKNTTTLSSGSSLNTVADDLGGTSSPELPNNGCSEKQAVEKASRNVEGVNGSGGRVRKRGIVISDSSKHHHNHRHHHQSESDLQKERSDVTGRDSSPKPEAVQLPERYRHVLRKCGSHGNMGGFGRKSSSSSSSSGSSGGGCSSGSGEDLPARERDLGTALAWIRNEMVQMKEQDKVLLNRFIELRTSILQLRCMYGSTSDIRSLDGSSVSLNDLQRRCARMRNADSDVTLSGPGGYVATSSLSLPCSPQLSRLRWRSDELA